ncbi:hypothetical protein Brsp05_03493 [Brucella sp. NBRC 12953]|uniref:hypothetical protein n=1 Tax=Brucella sp. NBRC 12953 TaxID=3075481 RepID=UPI00309D62E8
MKPAARRSTPRFANWRSNSLPADMQNRALAPVDLKHVTATERLFNQALSCDPVLHDSEMEREWFVEGFFCVAYGSRDMSHHNSLEVID